MPSVCFYFQVHQPYRLKHYPFFSIGKDHRYFDRDKNGAIFRKVAHKCYLPANQAMLNLIRRHDGRFRIAYSITGVAIDQMAEYAPEVLESFQELAATGCVELLGETYYHSLAGVYDEDEFRAQVALHAKAMQRHFGMRPKVFRNTELIYNDRVGSVVAGMGYQGMIAEGADDILGWRSPNFVYEAADSRLRLLLKNYRLSDDIAFRFSNRAWSEFPLTAPKFADWVHAISGNGETVNLFMDYETFGEHQWEATGIFEFLDHLPREVLKRRDWDFLTPTEVLDRCQPVAPISYGRTVSWADVDRDLTAWQGNHMQKSALKQVYDLAAEVRSRNNPATLDLWRRLQTSDHFYYMCTKWMADGDVHAYFSPYGSPYEAFINYMNVLTDFRQSVLKLKAHKEAVA
ncbi:MAG: glycoside hydrolase family 57 protein [Oligoflexia bacterium]|nr:glycoside hydrolase family 57 protein [Oligoflexia bacterium]